MILKINRQVRTAWRSADLPAAGLSISSRALVARTGEGLSVIDADGAEWAPNAELSICWDANCWDANEEMRPLR